MIQETIAGKSVGRGDDCVVVFDRETGDYKSLQIRGRYLYVKKCKRREVTAEGIALPDKTRNSTNICLVLAVGSGCGQWHELTNDDERLNKTVDPILSIVERTDGDIKVFDKVFVPDEDPYGGQKGISRTTYGDDEFLVHECIVFGAIEE